MGDRGCIRIDSRANCATKGGVRISNTGSLEAGFPPTQTPDETYPLCQIAYSIPAEWGPWAEVHFDVDELCLKGLKGERKFRNPPLFRTDYL